MKDTATSQTPANDNAAFSMEDFMTALDGFNYDFTQGQVVKGKVVSYESDGALIDIGGKSPAFLPGNEASVYRTVDLEGTLPIGEERSFVVIREQDADGQVTVSVRKFEEKKIWSRLGELQTTGESIQVRVLDTNKGGVTVNSLGLRGFIPRSHLPERGENMEGLVGNSLSVCVLEIDQDKNKIVLSNRNASRAVNISKYEIGQLIEGKVTSIRPFGVFIDFDGCTGLLRITEISKNYVKSLESVFEVGQMIKALIVNIDEGKGQIALSTKHLENHPGEMLENLAQVMAEADDRAERARKVIKG